MPPRIASSKVDEKVGEEEEEEGTGTSNWAFETLRREAELDLVDSVVPFNRVCSPHLRHSSS